ncbi:MAG: CPBP family intramembrane glutamic endopeptidase [Psychrilyobacter sp.]|uniref:CPBP family intramembrane glutamic endopeptidase n=1 Tax=Psychrilyobacter sp. TaxID=2586924 RepID=UPI003C78A037
MKKNSSYVLGDKKNLTLIFIILLGPLCEEIFFRGIVFKVFEKNSKLTVVVVSSMLFALDHGKVGIPILISGSSFYYGYVYMKTESLWNTIIIHVMNNGLVVFLILTKSQLLVEGPLYYPLGLSSVIISFYGFSKMYKFLKSQP